MCFTNFCVTVTKIPYRNNRRKTYLSSRFQRIQCMFGGPGAWAESHGVVSVCQMLFLTDKKGVDRD